MPDQWNEVSADRTPMWNGKDVKLKENAEIFGTYENVRTDVGPNKANIYEIRQDDGNLVGVWGSTVLDSRFENISIGARVKIVYRGEKRGKQSKPYKDYVVYVSGANKDEVDIVKEATQ